MSAFARDNLRVAVAKICQTIGWHSIQSSPLDVLVDILSRYLLELSRATLAYANEAGSSSPCLDDIRLAFRDMKIMASELEEYVQYVDSSPCIPRLPEFPVKNESHLNFLKPGSNEVVTRPVHIPEHLPPMYPAQEERDPLSSGLNGEDAENVPVKEEAMIFKRPAEISSAELQASKRPRLVLEEEGRPTREISSVMMTTSGFLSPAREGKLPEARTPLTALDSQNLAPLHSSGPLSPPLPEPAKSAPAKASSSSSSSSAVTPTPSAPAKDNPPPPKKAEKRRDKTPRDQSSLAPFHFEPLKPKTATTKDVAKQKALKSADDSEKPSSKASPSVKVPKSSQMSSMRLQSPIVLLEPIIDGKLQNEPDRQKLNILKKISKVKEEKPTEKAEKTFISKAKEEAIKGADQQDSRESSPRLVIDESELRAAEEARHDRIHHHHHQQQQQPPPPPPLPPQQQQQQQHLGADSSGTPDSGHDDDEGAPAATSTVAASSSISSSSAAVPSAQKEKRKRKDKSKVRKARRLDSSNASSGSPRTTEDMDLEDESKAESSQAQHHAPDLGQLHHPFYQGFPNGPGLIPNVGMLYPNPLAKHGFGQPPPHLPYLPPAAISALQMRADSTTTPTPTPSALSSPLGANSTATLGSLNTTSLAATSPSPAAASNAPSTAASQASLDSTANSPAKPVSPESTTPSSISKKGEKRSKEHRKEKKDKLKKKSKKDKVKNKSEKKKLKEEKMKEKASKKEKKRREKESQRAEMDLPLPKLTLKLGSASPNPGNLDGQPVSHKIMIKTVPKKPEGEEQTYEITSSPVPKREPSPELAKISALVTHPPKHRCQKPLLPSGNNSSGVTSATANNNINNAFRNFPDPYEMATSNNSPVKRVRNESKPSPKSSGLQQSAGGGGGGSGDKAPKIVEESDSSGSEGVDPVAYYFDNDGNKIWICPTCNGQDDGSPMIGCDDCDAWYHWVCVGIQVPPDDNEDWYCRNCISKKQESIQMDKKKKKKKKEKKEH